MKIHPEGKLVNLFKKETNLIFKIECLQDEEGSYHRTDYAEIEWELYSKLEKCQEKIIKNLELSLESRIKFKLRG